MKPVSFFKENWRVIMLVVFVLGALIALFVPGGVMDDDGYGSEAEENESWTEDPLNIEYGLGLEGGTRISAPVVGMTAENIDAGIVDDETGEVDDERIGEIEEALYGDEDLDIEIGDANVQIHDDGTVSAELFIDDVTEAEFVRALEDADVEVDEDDVREGVTQETRDDIITTIDLRINEAGLSGGQVTEAAMGDQHYVVTEVPEMGEDELREILEDRGIIEVVAYHPGEDGTQTNETVLTGDDIADVDPPTQDEGTGYEVPVQVESNSAPGFQEDMNDMGYGEPNGWGNCQVSDPQTGQMHFDDDVEQHCLLTVVDGEPVAAHSMSDRLGSQMGSGDWETSPSFYMGAQEYSEAQALSVNLQAGELRAPLDLDEGDIYSLQPALADQFKTYSLLIGLLAIVTVSGMVYLRYQDPRVAAPMVLTALAEVFILLGFAALIRMPLDLSHVAGFIAVVGTGVDDLIIIADEVMSEGDVNSQRVFESRFRKAFWIIGAAAATTIVAMSPLAVLSLGDLRGFAIITILGVLIGVLITRPAYGDILRRLLTDK